MTSSYLSLKFRINLFYKHYKFPDGCDDFLFQEELDLKDDFIYFLSNNQLKEKEIQEISFELNNISKLKYNRKYRSNDKGLHKLTGND
jgi:hypothetical protein